MDLHSIEDLCVCVCVSVCVCNARGSDCCDLAERLSVYLVRGQQGFREGCAPVDGEAWTSDLDPPVEEEKEHISAHMYVH